MDDVVGAQKNKNANSSVKRLGDFSSIKLKSLLHCIL